MADQGEGGIDASDDMDARTAALKQRTSENNAELARLQNKASEVALERARRKSNGSSSSSVSDVMSRQNDFSADAMRDFNDRAQSQTAGATDRRVDAANLARAGANKSNRGSLEKISDAGEELGGTLKSLSFAGIGLIAAFGTVAHIAASISESQKSGAKEIGDVRGSLGNSLRDMGVKGDAADKMIQSWEGKSAGPLDDPMKRAQYMAAIASSKRENNPLGQGNVDAANSVYNKFANDEISFDQAMDVAKNKLSSYDAVTTLNAIRPGGSQGRGAFSKDGQVQEAARSRSKIRSEGDNYTTGQDKLDREAYFSNLERGGGVSGAVGWAGNTSVGQFLLQGGTPGAAIDAVFWLRKIANSQPPPSTEPGK